MSTSIIDNFLQDLRVKGIGKNTVLDYKALLERANNQKSLDSWTKSDVNNFIIALQTNHKPATVEIYKGKIKKFFIWMDKEEIVKHLTIKIPQNTLKRNEILTIEDINKLIESTPSTLYKALIAFLFESGARINEVLAIKVKDVEEDPDKGMIISIPSTKTGEDYRRGLYEFSAQYIRNHITYCALNKDDRIFDINDTSAWTMLTKLGKKAGIEKPVNPHKFRHAQATDMVLRNYQESVIRKKLGWTLDSKMIARYQHLIDEDVINATFERNGLEPSKQIRPNIKKADPLKIADAGLQLKKLNDDLEESKKLNEEQKKRIDLLMELADKQQASLEEIREAVYSKREWEMTPMYKQEKEEELDSQRRMNHGLTDEEETKRIAELMKKMPKSKPDHNLHYK